PIERAGRRCRPRGRTRCRRRSSASLLAHFHRCVSTPRLGVGRDAAPHRDTPKVSFEFPRTCGARRGPVASAHERPVMTLRASIFALLVSAGTGAAFAQQPDAPTARRITLREAVDLALAHNHAVRLAKLSVEEKERVQEGAKNA